MKIYTQGEDGWTQYIWEMDDFTMESNEEWWKGQVDFNDHRVSSNKNIIKMITFHISISACVSNCAQ